MKPTNENGRKRDSLTHVIFNYSANVTMIYDGDGNRVSKTAAVATTKYRIDTQNPTGYAQVVDMQFPPF